RSLAAGPGGCRSARPCRTPGPSARRCSRASPATGAGRGPSTPRGRGSGRPVPGWSSRVLTRARADGEIDVRVDPLEQVCLVVSLSPLRYRHPAGRELELLGGPDPLLHLDRGGEEPAVGVDLGGVREQGQVALLEVGRAFDLRGHALHDVGTAPPPGEHLLEVPYPITGVQLVVQQLEPTPREAMRVVHLGLSPWLTRIGEARRVRRGLVCGNRRRVHLEV